MTESPELASIEPARPDGPRIVQVTDCHILAGDDDRLRGVNTRRSFEAVMTAAHEDCRQADLLLATGDLSEDGSREAYRYLSRQFESAAVPTFWLPGNHDDAAAMRAHLHGLTISDSRQVLAGGWLILLLDSTLEGRVEGRVSEAQMEFMDGALQRHAERHALVCLHHQAIAAGSEWLDAKGLENAAEFRQRLSQHGNVRGVLWGHVHQEGRHSSGGIEWMSTPSTCVQFKPGSREFALGDEAPGYRYLRLGSGGDIETRVQRVTAAWSGPGIKPG
jgi:Icc protein